MDRRPKTPAALAAWTGHTAPGIRALLAGAALLLCTGGTAYGQEIEAEAGVLLGNASVYADPAASGGRGIAYISSPDAGFRLTNVPAASGVNIRYASALSGSLASLISFSRFSSCWLISAYSESAARRARSKRTL